MRPAANPMLHNPKQERRLFRRRVLITIISIGLLGVGLIARLIYLQIYQHQRYATLASKNRLGLVALAPNRGLIFDRNGILLAENKPMFNLVIIPDQIKSLAETIDQLKKIIPIDSHDLRQFRKQLKLHSRFEPVPLRLKLSEEEVAKFSLEHYRFPGVSIQPQMIRTYPLHSTFAPLIGYVGRINENELENLDIANYRASNFIGKTGIEKYYEDQLHGKSGYQEIEINANGQTVRILKEIAPIPGKNLYLTVDSGLQRLAEQLLAEHSGAIVALNPSNGEILTFVSNPGFDPNQFVSGISQADYHRLQQASGHPLYNRALRGSYHPGSTIKPFLSLGALENDIVTPDTTIYDNGEFQLRKNGRIYHNFRHHKYGYVDLSRAIIISSDIYFYNLSTHMPIRIMDSILERFGFGQPTGIDLPDEGEGLLPTPEWKRKAHDQGWYPGDTLNCAIGQGFLLATPLQLASAIGTIAMNGQQWRPHSVLRIGSENSDQIVQPKLKKELNLDLKLWQFIQNTLRSVVLSPEGTAHRFFANAPYSLAGKTGTAQVFSLKSNQIYDKQTIAERLRDNSLFIAYAPYEHPSIALAIIIQNSQISASQIARKLLDYYFHQTEFEERLSTPVFKYIEKSPLIFMPKYDATPTDDSEPPDTTDAEEEEVED
jgi:penicillin-binding protein 2